MKKHIAEKIRQLHIIKNLSQENMTTELDISTRTYSNIERGKTELTVTRLFEIASLLKTDVFELLSKEVLKTSYENNDKQKQIATEDYLELKEKLNELQKEIINLKKQTKSKK